MLFVQERISILQNVMPDNPILEPAGTGLSGTSPLGRFGLYKGTEASDYKLSGWDRGRWSG